MARDRGNLMTATLPLELASTEISDKAPILGGRYRLQQLLGRGGQSEVFAADDLLTGAQVAIKLLHRGLGADAARVCREALALRMLRLPGVVRLLDEGVEDAQLFLVMERVEGHHFPGPGRGGSWPSITGVVIALLETLARIHAAGVVHRDLKPANVLVNDEGRPTVLDFGICSGTRLGDTIGEKGWIVGTPAYLAPEQILVEPVTPQTDLYALGVLLYEALSGQLPHAGADSRSLMRARLLERPPPLRTRAPDVPRAVAEMVDLLLARAPEARPGSAADVLAAIRGQPVGPVTGPSLPRLGGDAAVREVLDAVRARRSVDLVGPAGAGRSRCLAEVADALQSDGVQIAWTLPGQRAFSSVEPVLGPLDAHGERRLNDVVAIVEEALRNALARGLVVLADPADRLDRWSAAALERCRSSGAIVRVLSGPSPSPEPGGERGDEGAIRLTPLDEEALRPLFAGPDRIFHLRSDAARILWARTAGLQARVAEEVEAWVRAGIARWDGAALVIDRETLDGLDAGLRVAPLGGRALADARSSAAMALHLEELAAWVSIAWPLADAELLGAAMGAPRWRVEADIEELVQSGAARRLLGGRIEPSAATQADRVWPLEQRRAAHRAVGRALARGAAGRFFHLVAAIGDAGASGAEALEIADEAEALAAGLARDGRLGQALATLDQGLCSVRRSLSTADPERAAREERLLTLWVIVALFEATPQACDRALYEISRSQVHFRNEAFGNLEQLVRAAIAFAAGGDRAITLLDAMDPFAAEDLERHRQGLRVLSARRCSQEVEERVLGEVAAWAVRTGDAVTRARYATWLGRLRYRQGRFDEAARLHAEAADGEPWVTARIAARLNGASALMDAFRHQEAAASAEDALKQAKACRHPFFEARAEWVLRSTAYRAGAAMAPDLELVDAVARFGTGDLEATVCFNEAAIAYRAGRLEVARGLAQKALLIWESIHDTWPAVLIRCLALACGARPAAREGARLAQRAMTCSVPGIGVQALGLLAQARRSVPPSWKEAALSLTGEIPRRSWHVRMDILSVEEALEAIGVAFEGARRAPAAGAGERLRARRRRA